MKYMYILLEDIAQLFKYLANMPRNNIFIATIDMPQNLCVKLALQNKATAKPY